MKKLNAYKEKLNTHEEESNTHGDAYTQTTTRNASTRASTFSVFNFCIFRN